MIVSPEAGNPIETAPLHYHWTSTDRLSVDVVAYEPVNLVLARFETISENRVYVSPRRADTARSRGALIQLTVNAPTR